MNLYMVLNMKNSDEGSMMTSSHSLLRKVTVFTVIRRDGRLASLHLCTLLKRRSYAAGPSALLSVVNPLVGGCGRAVNELVV